MKAAQCLLIAFCALLSGAARAQAADPCQDAYNAEVARIQREARQHDGSEKAKQRTARLAESQTRLAASRARQCRSERGPAPAAGAGAKKKLTNAEQGAIELRCRAEGDARAAELNRRYRGRRLMHVEQVKYMEEHQRIKAGIQDCIQRSR
jgi:hypothetical protein